MAGLQEKVALVPRSRMPGAYALGPSEEPLLWVSGTPRSLLSLFYPRGGTRGMLSSFTPAFFCRWSRVESSQMFLSWLPLTASKMWLLLPRRLTTSNVIRSRLLRGRLREVGAARGARPLAGASRQESRAGRLLAP